MKIKSNGSITPNPFSIQQYNNNVDIKCFEIPRFYYGNTDSETDISELYDTNPVDLSKCSVVMRLSNPDDKILQSNILFLTTDKGENEFSDDDDIVVVNWIITDNVSQFDGKRTYQLEFYDGDVLAFRTQVMNFIVKKSLDTEENISQKELTILEQLEDELNEALDGIGGIEKNVASAKESADKAEECYVGSKALNDSMTLSKNELDERIANITDNASDMAEVIDARAGYTNLGLRLDKKPCFFNSVDEMKTSNKLKNGDVVETLGYYEINDGGAGTYKIRTKNTNDIIDNGSIIEISNELVAELIIGDVLNVKQFGAKGDGITDDYQSIQNVLDFAKPGNIVYFPRTNNANGKPSYLINSGLVLNKNEVTLKSESKTEYLEGIYSPEEITLLTINGYGCVVNNMAFYGNGNYNIKATNNGINIDRTSNGDLEEYSNLDTEINNCLFMYLNIGITGKGKNVFVKECTFTTLNIGIKGELHKYNNNKNYSEFRNWRIYNNRFHSMAYFNESIDGYTELNDIDSWCIELPLTEESSNVIERNEIRNNHCDLCYCGFYKGSLIGSILCDNYLNFCSPILIYSPQTMPGNSSSRASLISNNFIIGRNITNAVRNKKIESTLDNFINASYLNNCSILNNSLFNCSKNAFVINNSSRVYIKDNSIINSNRLKNIDDSSSYSCLKFNNSNNVNVLNNTTSYQYISGVPYFIEVDNDSTYFYMLNNITDRINNLTNLDVSKWTQPNNSSEWVLPTLENNFEFMGNDSKGYRKNSDGTADIVIRLTGGIKNKVAFTLPNGLKPAYNIYLPGISIFNGTNESYALIDQTGNVTINFVDGSITNQQYVINLHYITAKLSN